MNKIAAYIVRVVVGSALVIGSIVAVATLQSCKVKRVVLTEATCVQRGDTSVVISVKNSEIYDATKHQ